MVAFQLGAQSAEAMALQRLTPEGVAEVLDKARQLEEKKLDYQHAEFEREIETDERERERDAKAKEKQREREHELQTRREDRRWYITIAVLVGFVALVAAVFYAKGADAATALAARISGYAVVLAGGIGLEKLRREWTEKKRK